MNPDEDEEIEDGDDTGTDSTNSIGGDMAMPAPDMRNGHGPASTHSASSADNADEARADEDELGDDDDTDGEDEGIDDGDDDPEEPSTVEAL